MMTFGTENDFSKQTFTSRGIKIYIGWWWLNFRFEKSFSPPKVIRLIFYFNNIYLGGFGTFGRFQNKLSPTEV